jgi:hypothetical protein
MPQSRSRRAQGIRASIPRGMRSRQVRSAVALLTGAVGDASEGNDSKRSEARASALRGVPSSGTRVRTWESAPGVAVPTRPGNRQTRGRVAVSQVSRVSDQELHAWEPLRRRREKGPIAQVAAQPLGRALVALFHDRCSSPSRRAAFVRGSSRVLQAPTPTHGASASLTVEARYGRPQGAVTDLPGTQRLPTVAEPAPGSASWSRGRRSTCPLPERPRGGRP